MGLVLEDRKSSLACYAQKTLSFIVIVISLFVVDHNCWRQERAHRGQLDNWLWLNLWLGDVAFFTLFVYIQMLSHFWDLRALRTARRTYEYLVRSTSGLVAIVPFRVAGKHANAIFLVLKVEGLLANNLAQRGDVLRCCGHYLSRATVVFDDDVACIFHLKIVWVRSIMRLFVMHQRVGWSLAGLVWLWVNRNIYANFLPETSLAGVQELCDAVFQRGATRLAIQVEMGQLAVD